VGVPKLSCLIVASETYQRLNSNMSVDENLREIERINSLCAERGVTVMVGMGTAFICPYEGVLPEERILRLVDAIVRIGITEITLADSIGLAWPALVRQRLHALRSRWPELRLGLHLHSLAGLALANAWVAYETGIRRFDGSVGGIGGGIAMPIESAEMSNVATEDLVYLFASSGVHTGIDPDALRSIALQTRQSLGEGAGHVSGFGTLDAFLTASRGTLAGFASRPGDSTRAARRDG
jgi:hydroxymethylglutaryl-CoA lyase